MNENKTGGLAEKNAPIDPALNKTLDPDDWKRMRLLGHQMVDDMMDLMEHIGDQPVWRQIPAEVRKTYSDPVPLFCDFSLPVDVGITEFMLGVLIGDATMKHHTSVLL